MDWSEQSLTLEDGVRLRVALRGEGPAVVLLHGALVTHHDWPEALGRELAERATVAAFDRPGHGQSTRPRFAASPTAQARWVADAADRLGLQRPLVVGHSFGALVALAWAALRPEGLAGLVLVSPMAFPEWRPIEHAWLAPRSAPLLGPWLAQALNWSLDGPLLRLAQHQMFAPQSPPADWLGRYRPEAIISAAQSVEEGEDASWVLPGAFAAALDYPQLKLPTKILAGTADQVVDPHRHAARLAALLENSDLKLLSGVGHMLHHADPGAVAQAAIELLDVEALARGQSKA